MWEDILRDVGLDREAQREYLASTTFDTIDGNVKFTNNENKFTGDPNGANPPVFGQWQNGVFEVVWPSDVASAPLVHPKPEWP
jgi:branched-chain amino acid transport system substrate-binding protein